MITTLQVISFGLAIWLGFYLLVHDWRSVHLGYASLGLVSYAWLLLGDAGQAEASPAAAKQIKRLTLPEVLLPAAFWYLALPLASRPCLSIR